MKYTFALLAAIALAVPAQAGYILQIDTDGADDGPVTLNPNFSYGGNTTTASTSIQATTVGLDEGDSLFGGDTPNGLGAPNPDTYVYTYTPSADADNDDGKIDTGTSLNEFGDFGSGLPSGPSGTYAIYATWPDSGNISFGLPTTYVLNDGVNDILVTAISQDNDSGGFNGNQWIKLGEVALDSNTTYTLTQIAGTNEVPDPFGGPSTFQNGFVSMRAAGVYFDRVPEPASALLAVFGVAGLAFRRR